MKRVGSVSGSDVKASGNENEFEVTVFDDSALNLISPNASDSTLNLILSVSSPKHTGLYSMLTMLHGK